MAGTIQTTVTLLAVEAVGIFLLYLIAKYVFGIDITDFKSPRGHMIGLGLAAVFLYTIYSTLFENPGGIRQLGATATYETRDANHTIATSSVKPLLV